MNIFTKILGELVYDLILPLLKNKILEKQRGKIHRDQFNGIFTIYNELRPQVDLLITDFSKVFNNVNHNILISKLSEVGIHGN